MGSLFLDTRDGTLWVKKKITRYRTGFHDDDYRRGNWECNTQNTSTFIDEFRKRSHMI